MVRLDLGINVTGDSAITPQSIVDIGSGWARFVMLQHFDVSPWIAECHSMGLKILGVMARESLAIPKFVQGRKWSQEKWLAGVGNGRAHARPSATRWSQQAANDIYSGAAQIFAQRYPSLDAVQCGNESDHISPSSWTMTPQELNQLISTMRSWFPCRLIGPGLVSGDPSYLANVDTDSLDAIAVHPYGQRPYGSADDWRGLPGNFGVVGDLLARYRAQVPGKPIWVTECGVSSNEASQPMQGLYCEEMMRTLRENPLVDVGMWFCMGDWMVDGFGLYGLDGNAKPAAQGFKNAAGVVIPGPTDQPKYVLGFKQIADAEPQLVGAPLENEYGVAPGISAQFTNTPGVLFWANTVESGSVMGFINLSTRERYKWDGSRLVKVSG